MFTAWKVIAEPFELLPVKLDGLPSIVPTEGVALLTGTLTVRPPLMRAGGLDTSGIPSVSKLLTPTTSDRSVLPAVAEKSSLVPSGPSNTNPEGVIFTVAIADT